MSGPSFTLDWHGEKAKRAVREGAADGVSDAAEFIMGKSKEVVPIEEATLARSGTVSVDRAQIVAAMSYDTEYAVIQHERLDFRHDPGRTAKYLENPMNQSAPDARRIIAAAIARRLA